METKRSMARLWELAESEHGRLIRSVLSAVFGVICGMLPYFAAARMISGLFPEIVKFSFMQHGVFWLLQVIRHGQYFMLWLCPCLIMGRSLF